MATMIRRSIAKGGFAELISIMVEEATTTGNISDLYNKILKNRAGPIYVP